MKLVVKIYDKSKYEVGSKKVAETTYDDVEKFTVETISPEKIAEMGYDEVDELNEYLTLTFKDGSASTFRNSHADIFRY